MELQVKSGTFENDRNSQWHVAMVGDNGEIMMFSENYFDKGNAIRAANSLADKIAVCEGIEVIISTEPG